MQPPPERSSAIKARTYIVSSFWVVILLLGLPTWWKTTSIPRAALPIPEMIKWENEKPQYNVELRLSIPGIPCDYAHRIASDTQNALDQQNELPTFRIHTQLVYFPMRGEVQGLQKHENTCNLPQVEPGKGNSALDIELLEADVYRLDVWQDVQPFQATFARKDVQRLGLDLANDILKMFADEQAAVAFQHVSQGVASPETHSFVQALSQEAIANARHNSARALKASPEYHLTFSMFTAEGTPSSWSIDFAVEHYIMPLLHSLSPIANISVNTQVQMYSAFSSSIHPIQRADEKGWFLREQDLTAFVNTAEWPLSPSIGSGPTINFILYIPAMQQIPLGIENGTGGAWLIPQWGGITIVNPPLIRNPETGKDNIVSHLDDQILKPAFETFRTQLLTLIGLSATPKLPLSLRLKAFQRLAGLSLYLRSSSSLGSLARLADRLSNIPIPHHVVDLVEIASLGLLKYRDQGSVAAARTAYTASEKAFFDKSMVGQVYFPDEHKVAVYLPLLGPIGVPLVIALLREIKQRLVRR